MNDNRLYQVGAIIEAILFVAGDSIKIDDLSKAINISKTETELAIETLKKYYENNSRGLCLKIFNDNIQLTTKSDYSNYITRVLQPIQKQNIT
ncbi:MAG: SMC-Scp complex subunit ScpB, partial [Christensenellaceae bacterium]|nr:SMC-Scp complex subunit ScpB [Christensenellaceae bacterium]